jgi:hypothetical protein
MVEATRTFLNASPVEARLFYQGGKVCMTIPAQIRRILDHRVKVLPETCRVQIELVDNGFLCRLVPTPSLLEVSA